MKTYPIGIAVSVWLGWSPFLFAQQPPAQERKTPEFISTAECAQCHFPPAGGRRLGDFDEAFVKQEEAAIWDEQDKHRQAIYLLLNDKNRPLTEQILGFPVSDVLSYKAEADKVTDVRLLEDGDADKLMTMRQCLACHAPVAEPVSAENREGMTLEFGVSCQACHGPGQLYTNPHQDRTRVWRVMHPDVKQQQFGMRDLRNPATRAELCFSCHVGSMGNEADAGRGSIPRFVKHEWYANGHPPLPSIEFSSFAIQMPAHWRTLKEKVSGEKTFRFFREGLTDKDKADFVDALPRSVNIDPAKALAGSYLEANHTSYSKQPGNDMARTKDVVISGVQVLASYASLMAKMDASGHPEFSFYDCGACHHELRSQFPTIARVRRNVVLGRPPMPYWTRTLATIGAQHLAASFPDETFGPGNVTSKQLQADLQQGLLELDRAFSARPFGNPAAIRAAAEKLSATLTTIGQALAQKPLDQAAAQSILRELATPQGDEERDYHASRQLAWAIREVTKDLAGLPYREAPREFPVDFKFLEPWEEQLQLNLPSGQRESVVDQLAESLAAIAQHDPERFSQQLKLVRERLAAPPK